MSGEDNTPLPYTQQHHASAVPTADAPLYEGDLVDSTTQVAEVEETVEAVEEQAYASRVSATVLVTLDYSEGETYTGLKGLKDMETRNGRFNFHNPLKSANVEKDPNAREGVARSAVSHAIHLASEINSSNMTLLGTDEQTFAHLKTLLHKVRNEVYEALPVPQDELLRSIPLVDTEDASLQVNLPLTMGEFVRVTGWINVDSENDSTFEYHNLVINIKLNAGAFYDSEDPQKHVMFVRSQLKKLAENASVEILLNVLLDPETLVDPKTNDLFNILISEGEKLGFHTVKRSSILKLNAVWAPQSQEAVDKLLLSKEGDLMLAKVL